MKIVKNNTKDSTRSLAIVLIIIIVSFSVVVAYLIYQVNFRDSELVAVHEVLSQQYINGAKLGAEIVNLQNQIAALNANISTLEGLKAPNVVIALGCTEIVSNESYYDHLWITGTATDEGLDIAYNVGLNVVAYDINGNQILNITVPMAAGTYGNGESLTPLITLAPLQQVDLQGTGVGIAIYHEGLANTWNLKAVWTDSP